MKLFEKVKIAYQNYLKRPKQDVQKENIEVMTIELDEKYAMLYKKLYALFDIKIVKATYRNIYYVVTSNANSLLALELYDYMKQGIEKEVKEEYTYIKALSESERLAQYGMLTVPKTYATSLYLEKFLTKINHLYEHTLFEAKATKGAKFNLQDYMLPKAIREYDIGGKEDGK